MEAKKKNVSLRMSQFDIDRVKLIADRLGVKESDIYRFSVKQMITKLALFQEDSYAGKDLMPALLEVGEELANFFDLSSDQLDEIVNAGVEEVQQVEKDDLKLLALAAVNQEYVKLKLSNESHAKNKELFDLKSYLKSKYYRSASEEEVQKSRKADWARFVTTPSQALMPKSA